VAEVLSPSNAENDLGPKLLTYHAARVGHYWVIDPKAEVLSVYRWTADGYVLALSAGRKERVRAEPCEAIELEVGALFGVD
jgi:Uma2 family endonuclease